MPTVLHATDLARSYGSERGLFGVDLEIAAGEIYGLLGPNGAGKTSLVRAISGRLGLERGTVTLAGGDPFHDRAARRALGLVPQAIALYRDLTVGENLVILGQLAGLDRTVARVRAEEALRWIDLADRAGSAVKDLSAGQQRRVNLAAGTLHHPAVLVLDEPTVGVDIEARARIHAMLGELKARGTAILLATHDFAEAAALADRIGILVAGTLRAEGAPAELVRRFFADGFEVQLTLARPPEGALRERLTTLGLSSSRDALRWSGPHPGGVVALPSLVGSVTEAGGAVVASEVRAPDLDSVYRRVTGQESVR
ncbi:MAG: ABC transporter ATP-binding protein [Gemmatimonadales bacterium]